MDRDNQRVFMRGPHGLHRRRQSAVVGRVKFGEAHGALHLGEVLITGDGRPVRAGGDKPRRIGIAVRVNQQPRKTAYMPRRPGSSTKPPDNPVRANVMGDMAGQIITRQPKVFITRRYGARGMIAKN